MIIAADYQNTLNILFNYTLSFDVATDSTLNAITATGTAFAGGPAILPAIELTGGFTLDSLPIGARSIYDDGLVSTVTLFNVGLGQIVQLGYD